VDRKTGFSASHVPALTNLDALKKNKGDFYKRVRGIT
jgi:hypothetical protein